MIIKCKWGLQWWGRQVFNSRSQWRQRIVEVGVLGSSSNQRMTCLKLGD